MKGRPKSPPMENPSYVCEQCGKLHQVNNKYKLKVRKYCSISCANKARPVLFGVAAFVGPPKPKHLRKKSEAQYTTIICLHCEKEHRVQKSAEKRGAKFCSNSCQMQYKYKDHVKVPRDRKARAKTARVKVISETDIYLQVQRVRNLDGEQWAQVISAEQRHYFVSNMGRFKSVDKIYGSETLVKGSAFKRNKAMRETAVYVHIGARNYELHQLVARNFVQNPKGYKFIDWRDGNRLNNRADNLTWGPAKYADVTDEMRLQNFIDNVGMVCEWPGVVHNVIQYVLTDDVSFINKAWSSALLRLPQTIKGLCFIKWKSKIDDDTAQDITQNTLMKLKQLLDAKRMSSPVKMESYIKSTAVREMLQYFQKNPKFVSVHQDNNKGDKFSLYETMTHDEYAYTPTWGQF